MAASADTRVLTDEPLLQISNQRFVLFPIQYPDIWSLYKQAQASFWVAEEIDISQDLDDWKSLSNEEQNFLSTVLAFFAASDGIVNENLVNRFCTEVTLPEARCFYGFQIMMENIHSEIYANMLANLITDPVQQYALFNAINEIPCIQRKANWALRWVESQDISFATRLLAFAAVEGIFFSASFASIFWLRQKGIMPGLCFSNEFISRDEGLHTEFASVLFKHLNTVPLKETAYDIIGEAVEIEKSFARDALSISLIGLNARLMETYIEFVADRLLWMLGYPAIYNASNPFPFMELISMEGKANFFERQVSAYRLPWVNESQIDPELFSAGTSSSEESNN